MPSARQNKPYFNFSKGLFTEASPLNYPENASVDEANFVLNKDGSRSKRLGLDLEDNYVYNIALTGTINEIQQYAITTFIWRDAANIANNDILVAQIGRHLTFYRINDATNNSVSSTYFAALDISNASQFRNERTKIEECDFAIIRGHLLVVHPSYSPFYISYETDSNGIETITWAGNQQDIKIRDFVGVPSDFDIAQRPDGDKLMPLTHYYNLINAGWTSGAMVAFRDNINNQGGGSYSKEWPSISEQMWRYKDPATNKYDFGSTSAGVQDDLYFGNTVAPKGHMLLKVTYNNLNSNLHNDRNTSLEYPYSVADTTAALIASLQFELAGGNVVTGIPDWVDLNVPLKQDAIGEGFSAVATYAGRVFYDGMIRDTNQYNEYERDYSDTVFFTQIVDNVNKLDRCYQEADPTSEYISEVVATDGGTIEILGKGKTLKLVPYRDKLLVFSVNGIWAIDGGDSFFSATNYRVTKVSDEPAISKRSIIQTEGELYYWTDDGIYVLGVDNDRGGIRVQNLTRDTINTLYNSISPVAKGYVKGTYDKSEKTLRWLYNNAAGTDSTTYKYTFNSELVYDLVLQAFTKNEWTGLATNTPFVIDTTYISTRATTTIQTPITDSGIVVTDSGANVYILENVPDTALNTTRYLTFSPTGNTYNITFSNFKSDQFKDWISADGTGVDYSAYLITGYELLQDSARNKQSPYITCHFNQTETQYISDGSGGVVYDRPSSCLLTGRWEWAGTDGANRWSTPQQVYRLNKYHLSPGVGNTFDYGLDVISTKSRLRGHGRTLSLKFETEAGKDCQLLGWQITFTGRGSV